MTQSLRSLLLLTAVASWHLAAGHSFTESYHTDKAEVEESLKAKFEDSGYQTPKNNGRMAAMKKALATTYDALPKNSNGLLDHQVVRYALHRMFVQRNGWYIKGLEPNGEDWHHDAAEKSGLAVKEWVPDYLQTLLEDKLDHKGMSYDGLATLAAVMEDLVYHEASNRLKTAYQIHGLSESERVPREVANDVVRTWYVGFLLAGNFSANSLEEVHQKKAVFARKYTDWKDADQWLRELEEKHYHGQKGDATFDFNWNLNLVEKIEEQYFRFNDKECKALKTTLTDMEGKKAGRVRLSTFYQKSLYSHWRFTEKAEYLRKLGALDESDPKHQQVIVTNYLMARPNCLESSSLYALCCRNECEDLMGELEGNLKTASATPERIAELVAKMSSDTVTAPRELSQPLRSRLQQVAAINGGQVPIHGRLFAQWMHHAYPRECPYPHESGTTAPQTPDEWMKETGASASSATDEEMQQQVESDSCAIDENGRPKGGAGCDEGEDLPWNEAEELLGSGHAAAEDEEKEEKEEGTLLERRTQNKAEENKEEDKVASSKKGFEVMFAAAMALMLAVALVYDYWRTTATNRQSKGEVFYVNQISSRDLSKRLSGCTHALIIWALASTAWVMDLLDNIIFACSMCGGLIILGARHFGEKFRSKDKLGKL